MADLVVTVPKWFWFDWIAEGDAAGSKGTGEEWGFTCGYNRPPAAPGDRCYIVAHDRLRGYAPITRIAKDTEAGNGWAICRGGDAVAVTVPERIVGFRGWRERWWQREIEVPFPDWQTANVAPEWFRKHAMELLDELYSPAEAKLWMRSPQQLLGMHTPNELIERGDGVKVLMPLQALLDGAYL